MKAGDEVIVYGEEGEDGYLMGEINGKRGLVPGNFVEEVDEDEEGLIASEADEDSTDVRLW